MSVLKDGEAVINYLEEKSIDKTTEENMIDIMSAEVEPTINFEAENYEQIMTKGGLRWIKKV